MVLHFIDLGFAGDILLIARSAMEVARLLDSLVAELSEARLLLNADPKKKIDNLKSTAFDNHDSAFVRQHRAETVGLHVQCVRIGRHIL